MGGGYPPDWKDTVEKAQCNLEKKGYTCPLLPINFRNSKEIFDCTNNIQKSATTTGADVQNVLQVNQKGNTISSSPPTMYNFNCIRNKMKQEDLNNVFGKGVNELRERMYDSENNAYVVLYDEDYFDLKSIYDSLSKQEKNIKSYPSYHDPDPEKELKDFLHAPVGCLITTHKLFKGAECENALILQRSSATSHNLRGTLMRVVSHLVILNGVSDQGDQVEYGNIVIQNDLLYCMVGNECDRMYECLTCKNVSNNEKKETKYICASCKMRCHENKNHKFKLWDVQNLNKKCECVKCKK